MTYTPIEKTDTFEEWRLKFNTTVDAIEDDLAVISADYVPLSYLDTDTSLTNNSDTKVATQKATKAYADLKIPTSYLDTDTALAANSDTKLATQKAIRTYVNALTAANDALVYKGVIDCSANPNYPAADAGHFYRISVAGKIGGASGVNVEAGDMALCILDGSSSGNQATVGSRWSVVQGNLDGAVIGPASAVADNFVAFDLTTGKLIKDSLYSPSSFQAANANLTAFAGLSLVANKMPYANGTGTLALADYTALARTLTACTTESAMRGVLGLNALTYPLMNYGGMNFDGSTNYLSGNPLTGIVDGKKGTIAIAIRYTGASSGSQAIMGNTSTRFEIDRLSDGKIQVFARNAAGTNILSVSTTTNVLASAGTYCILISYDLATSGSTKIYVNDVLQPNSVTTFTNDNIDYTQTGFGIGANAAGSIKSPADIYSIWFDSLNNMDFDVEANRRKFFDANNVPIFLGPNGELPTGVQPILFLGYSPYTSWFVNRGWGVGTFTVNGTSAAPITSLSGQYGYFQVDLTAAETAQAWMQISEVKALPVDYVMGWADGFKTSTRLDLVNSNAVTFTTGLVYNVGTGGALIPLMTTNTAPSGTASASTNNGGGYEAYRAFNQDNGSAWYSSFNTLTGWLEYQFPSNTTVSHYKIKAFSTNTDRTPAAWTFEYHNGSTWVVADTRSSQTGWAANEDRYYALATPVSATRFRINITAIAGGTQYIQVNEFQMYLGKCPIMSQMTSDSGPGGVYTFSHTYGGYECYQMNDNSYTSYYSTNYTPSVGSPGWFRFTKGSSMTLGSYKMGIRSDILSAFPRDWTIWYHNGSTWVLADTRTGQDGGAGAIMKEYTLATPVTSPTGAFEFRCTASNGGTWGLSEFQWYTPDVVIDSNIITVGQSLGVNPNYVDIYVTVGQIDALTLGTDIKIYGSRNNGVTWTEGTYTYVGHGGEGTVYKATINLTAQSAGNQLCSKVSTFNSKRMYINAINLKGY